MIKHSEAKSVQIIVVESYTDAMLFIIWEDWLHRLTDLKLFWNHQSDTNPLIFGAFYW